MVKLLKLIKFYHSRGRFELKRLGERSGGRRRRKGVLVEQYTVEVLQRGIVEVELMLSFFFSADGRSGESKECSRNRRTMREIETRVTRLPLSLSLSQ